MVERLERLFPGLQGSGYQITSPGNDLYNCVAWAAGENLHWWWPDDSPRRYWPPGVLQEETVPGFEAGFASLGYTVCTSEALEDGFEKIAIFADTDGWPMHVARQVQNGRWTSKLGELEDIEHGLRDLEGSEYGSVVRIMRRRWPNLAKQA